MANPPLPANATWTIDELAAKANSALDLPESPDAIGDSRFSAKLTARNIRSLQSQGAISKPVKVGREAFYGEAHYQELLDARKMMASGISAKGVNSLREASSQAAPLPPLAQTALAKGSPSTAEALSFLDGLLDSPSARPQNAAFAESAPSLMSSGYKAMRGASAESLAPQMLQARVEAEPFDGLRVSALPPRGSSPMLSDEQKKRALAAIELAWASAVSQSQP